MVEVQYKARLGNNLFQYCLGRIIAEELGHSLTAPPIPGFPGTKQILTGHSVSEPIQKIGGNGISLEAILCDRTPRRIILDGWFQRSEYYVPYRDQIRSWLAFDESIRVPDVAVDLVVHVRRTDYVTVGWALPFSYYERAICELLPQGGHIWIVTDDPADPFFVPFRRFNTRFFPGGALEQMLFMARAPRLIISQSTFSWWPAFLARDQQVACPMPDYGCWADGPDDTGVRLTTNLGFRRISCSERYEPTEIEANHQRRRAKKRNTILRLNRWFKLSLPVPAP